MWICTVSILHRSFRQEWREWVDMMIDQEGSAMETLETLESEPASESNVTCYECGNEALWLNSDDEAVRDLNEVLAIYDQNHQVDPPPWPETVLEAIHAVYPNWLPNNTVRRERRRREPFTFEVETQTRGGAAGEREMQNRIDRFIDEERTHDDVIPIRISIDYERGQQDERAQTHQQFGSG